MACIISPVVMRTVPSVDRDQTVKEAVALMVRHNTGSVVVTEGSEVTGFFTERDLLSRVVGADRDPARTSLGEVMSSRLITIGHDASCGKALARMRDHRIRHLLVYDGDRYDGVVSLRDVSALAAREKPFEDVMLKAVYGVLFGGVLLFIAFLIYISPHMLTFINRGSG